jgi:hypothetical protein
MQNVFSALFLLLSIILQVSCQTLPIEGRIKTSETLTLSIPTKILDLQFLTAYKQIKPRHYYYESSRWVNKNKTLDFSAAYYYLLDNYIFLDEETIEDLITKSFEDRVLSTGSERTIRQLITELPKKEKIISIVPFTLEDASCYYFRRFINFTGGPIDSITGGGSVEKVKGDTKITGYLCNYGSTAISNDVIDNFLLEIEAGRVFINSHLVELEKINHDKKI